MEASYGALHPTIMFTQALPVETTQAPRLPLTAFAWGRVRETERERVLEVALAGSKNIGILNYSLESNCFPKRTHQ